MHRKLFHFSPATKGTEILTWKYCIRLTGEYIFKKQLLCIMNTLSLNIQNKFERNSDVHY